jgi:hypothetical protein
VQYPCCELAPTSPRPSPYAPQESFDELYSDLFAFAWPRSDGAVAELKPGGADTPLTYATRAEWCELLLRSRCRDECESQARAVRRGLAQLVPVSGLALFTVEEVERLVCGEARRFRHPAPSTPRRKGAPPASSPAAPGPMRLMCAWHCRRRWTGR